MFRVYPDAITDSRKLDARVPWDSHGTSNGRPMDVQWMSNGHAWTSQAWTRGTSKRLDAWDVPWDARGTLGTSVGRLGRPWDVRGTSHWTFIGRPTRPIGRPMDVQCVQWTSMGQWDVPWASHGMSKKNAQ